MFTQIPCVLRSAMHPIFRKPNKTFLTFLINFEYIVSIDVCTAWSTEIPKWSLYIYTAALHCAPKLPIFTCIFANSFFYIRIFQCERMKIWRAWCCFKWLLLLPLSSITCCTLQLVFLLKKRRISENMVYFYKLSMTVVRIILVLYMVLNSCVIICLPTDTSMEVHLTLQNFIISKCYEDFLCSEYLDQRWCYCLCDNMYWMLHVIT